MKELLNEIRELFQNNVQKKNFDDDEEELEFKEKIRTDLEKELDAEIHNELKILGIIGSVMLVVLVIIGCLVFTFRKNIMNTVSNWTHSLIEFSNQFIKEEPPVSNTETSNEDSTQTDGNQGNTNSSIDSFNCTKNYDATYKGSYEYHGTRLEETITIMSDGSYSFVIGENDVSLGTYTINGGSILLKETSFAGNTSANGFNYSISKDCFSISRKLSNGATIILKKA